MKLDKLITIIDCFLGIIGILILAYGLYIKTDYILFIGYILLILAITIDVVN